MSIKLIKKQKIWGCGFVELWDFSEANTSQENREGACAFVSEVCRGKKIVNPKKHYQRLLTEHNGKSSEILQFIPFIDNIGKFEKENDNLFNKYTRFGYIQNAKFYTNLRNVYNNDQFEDIPVKELSNNKDDCKDFIVFKLKIPYFLLMHLVRHKRISSYMAENWQSNRSKHEIEYYIENKLKQALESNYSYKIDENSKINNILKMLSFDDFSRLKKKYKFRHELIGKGEMGLRYQTLFFAGWKNDPAVWDNFFGVRTVNPTQKETQELANTMLAMMKKYCDYAE